MRKTRGRYPVIGAENEAGELLGFASYGPFRAWPAYKYTVEHSVYVDARFRGQGVGRTLLAAIIDAAEKQDYHVMVGGIDASNAVSIRLHENLGFKACGIVRHAGFKFGRWLDLAVLSAHTEDAGHAGGRLNDAFGILEHGNRVRPIRTTGMTMHKIRLALAAGLALATLTAQAQTSPRRGQAGLDRPVQRPGPEGLDAEDRQARSRRQLRQYLPRRRRPAQGALRQVQEL